jgi:hypothetical protein
MNSGTAEERHGKRGKSRGTHGTSSEPVLYFVLLKSGVKIAGFIRIGRKLRICTEIYAAVDQSFMELASGLQRFQLVNSMQDFLDPHHYEGRVG